MYIYTYKYMCMCIMSVHLFYKKNELSYIRMYECTYGHPFHYLLSKVMFKYERKLVGTSVRVYISTYVYR